MDAVDSWQEIGARIAEARRAAGLSQGDVAKKLEIDRTAVVRLESGDRHVGALELMRLAEFLGVPMSHFLSKPLAAVVSRRAELTDDSDQAVRTRYRMDAALEAHARDTRWLVEHAGLPRIDASRASALQQYACEPETLAQAARAVIGATRGPLGPLADVAEHFGLYLTVVDIDAEGVSLGDELFGAAVIGTSAYGRRRWTAAHELGHHLFQDEYHSDIGISASRDEREQLIDRFVGEFLLPLPDLNQRFEALADSTSNRDKLVAIAGEYRLSWSAVVAQARNAGLITPADARRISVETPVKGDFMAVLGTEPQPDLEVGAAGPRWRKAVLQAWTNAVITGPRAVELLHGTISIDELPARNEVRAA